ncbi:MAG: diguanylate cyclase [Coriobacteriia bacterium]|nr:diguanylate cyclase [Coriobacteriia bacterium]
MKYARFEQLTIGVGAAAILATIVMALRPSPDITELIAQVLLLIVLVGAVHWGRKGGLIAAIGATIAYMLMRVQYMDSGATSDIIQLVLVRSATYGLVGIVGGELCGRIKYFFARLEDSCSIDEHSRVYNQKFFGSLMRNSFSSFQRYQTPFSIVVIEMAPCLTSDLRPSRAGALVRAVADHIRNDVRLVDDVGRLDDGRFILLLPHTPKDGAHVASARVRAGVRDVLGAKDDSITARVLSATEDLAELGQLLDEIAPIDATDAATQV